MTSEEIVKQAWRELIVGAQSYRDDWLDEEGEYTEQEAEDIVASMDVILANLRRQHP